MTQPELLIYLIACALHGEKPDEAYLAGADLDALYQAAAAQSLTACVCMALEKTDAFAQAEPAAARRWTDAKNNALRRSIMFDAERSQILAALDRAGVWYMPLKGSVLKSLYPREGMREMGDNDILYDADRIKDVQAIFAQRGYAAVSVGAGVHDVYKKPPFYSFEMHRSLFSPKSYPELAAYYRDVAQRLLPGTQGGCSRRLSDNDLYVHIAAHAGKHYNTAPAWACAS